MVHYSINEPRRLPVWFILAILASTIVAIIQENFTGSEWYKWWAPSGLMIFGILLTLTDFLFNKFAFVSKLMFIPNFSGTYTCTLRRESEDGSVVETKAGCTIQQRFLKMSICFEGRGCTSHATCAGIIIHGDNLTELQWCYASHDMTGDLHPDKYHPGTTQIQFNKVDKKSSFKGRYFTSNGRRGSVTLIPVDGVSPD